MPKDIWPFSAFEEEEKTPETTETQNTPKNVFEAIFPYDPDVMPMGFRPLDQPKNDRPYHPIYNPEGDPKIFEKGTAPGIE